MRTKDLMKLVGTYQEMVNSREPEEVVEDKSPPTSIESAYRKMWEDAAASRKKKTAGATKPEEILSKESGKSKEFVAQHVKAIDDTDVNAGPKDAVKAGRGVGKQSGSRRGTDNLSNGDKTPVK